jgi:hypothetical protein
MRFIAILLPLFVFSNVVLADSNFKATSEKVATCNYKYKGELIYPKLKDSKISSGRAVLLNVTEDIGIATYMGNLNHSFSEELSHLHVAINQLVNEKNVELAYARLPIGSEATVTVEYQGIEVSCRFEMF